MMDAAKRARLEAHGWKVGTVAEFLDLTPEETALIEMKLALSDVLRVRREQQMSQAELAAKLDVSPRQVASAETGDTSVSLEWLIRAMLVVGATPREIGTVIASVET
jgi:DNA-binding XRE family transcriptional regulator